MTLKLGAYTACLHDRPLADALGVLASNGLTSVEVNARPVALRFAPLRCQTWGGATSHPQEAQVTTPPDFGGHEIEEGLLEDLGGPQEKFPVSHQDGPGTDFSDNELHAAGQTCPRCGTVIQPGQDVRLRADRQWIHEACPAVP